MFRLDSLPSVIFFFVLWFHLTSSPFIQNLRTYHLLVLLPVQSSMQLSLFQTSSLGICHILIFELLDIFTFEDGVGAIGIWSLSLLITLISVLAW